MFRTAIDDGINDLEMVAGHGIAEATHILRAEGLEDVPNRRHAHLLSSGH